MKMSRRRNQLVSTFLIGCIFWTSAVDTGTINTMCSKVNMPLTLACDQSEVIYIHETTLTDWPGSILASTCELPVCNQYCRASTHNHDIHFNGRQTARYTFWRESLIGHDFLTGNCNASSSSNLVHVRYECLAASSLNNVCSNAKMTGLSSGFLTSPGFPGSPPSQQNGCQCDLKVSDNGIVTMTAIIINPILTDHQPRWTFEVVDEKGKFQIMDSQALFSSTIDIHSSNKIKVKFSSTGDTTGGRTHFTSYPSGFWVKYSAFPLLSTITLQCTAPPDEKTVSAVTVGVSCALVIAFILFTLAVVYVGRKWWRNKHPKLRVKQPRKATPGGGHDNYGLEFDSSSDRWTETEVPDFSGNRCMSLPEIYLAQQIGKMKLAGHSTPRKGRVEGRRKISTASLPSTSSHGLSVITNEIVREFDEFDDMTGSYESFAAEIFYLEGITFDEVEV